MPVPSPSYFSPIASSAGCSAQPSVPESKVISLYRRIALVSADMREAAMCQKWDRLLDLGHQYVDAVQALKNCPKLENFSADERQARIRLLLEIVDNDALIRDLAQPELARVGRLISRFSRNRAAIKAYQNASDGAVS